jgi:hypothetical protein
MRTPLLILVVLFFGTISTVSAQSINGVGSVSFELSPVQHESLTMKQSGEDIRVGTTGVGLGYSNLGFRMGYGISKYWLVGGRFLLSYANTSVQDDNQKMEGSVTSVFLLPNLQGMFPISEIIRLAIGLNIGYHSLDYNSKAKNSEEDSDIRFQGTFRGLSLGPNLGVHFFVNESCSIDLDSLFLYEMGSPNVKGESHGHGAEGYYFGVMIGASLWWGSTPEKLNNKKSNKEYNTKIQLKPVSVEKSQVTPEVQQGDIPKQTGEAMPSPQAIEPSTAETKDEESPESTTPKTSEQSDTENKPASD